MTKYIYEYKMQFAHDETSCLILECLVRSNWVIVGCVVDDGYTWLLLRKELFL